MSRAVSVEQMSQNSGSRAFAVCAGDADHAQLARRITVSGTGCNCGSLAAFSNHDRGKSRARYVFDHRCGSAELARPVEIIMPVPRRPTNGDEQRRRNDPPAVVRNCLERFRQISFDSGKQSLSFESRHYRVEREPHQGMC